MSEWLRRFLSHVATPMVAGCILYLWARPPILPLHHVLQQTLGWKPPHSFSSSWIQWIAGWAPDAAWAYSGTYYFYLVWKGDTGPTAPLWRLLVPCLATCLEVGQGMHLIPGTFDPMDLVTMLCAARLAGLAATERPVQT